MVVSRGGLRLVFDLALDGAAWPGSLSGCDAQFGDTWCGTQGLLGRLETELGLVTPPRRGIERAVEHVHRLGAREGYWSKSFETEPLATASRLLADRDLLALSGWNGQSIGGRLDALWRATADALPGVPDRLRRIIGLLPKRSVDISSIVVLEAVDLLPPLWQQLFSALAASGIEIAHRPIAPAPARGDLAAARGTTFEPAGDGSLILVRPHGPLAAADEIAASLAACASLDGVVLIGADDILDAALARHGMPRVGESRGATGASSLVRLVVEAAFTPADPDDIHALICADPGPVNWQLKGRLVGALGKFPARGSAEWNKALADGLASVKDEARDAIEARFAALVEPVVARDAVMTFAQLEKRLKALATWAHGRAATEETLRATAVFAERVITFARATRESQFGHTRLRRLLDELEPPLLAGLPAEVGLPVVASPAAIVGPARTIVWWNFTRESAPTPPRLLLSGRERAALQAVGVVSPDAGVVMAGEARRWKRPLEMATDHLVLVCPRTDEGSHKTHAHPLWDELTARVKPGGRVSLLESSRARMPAVALRTAAEQRPLVKAAASVKGPAIDVGDTASPSSLEKLLSCSLAWALERRGKLYGGLGTGPGAPKPLHYGNIAHRVLEEVFSQPVVGPAEAAARADALYEAGLSRFAEALLLPHYQTNRAELKRGIVESAREVAKLVEANGATVAGVEKEIEGMLGDLTVKGRVDLLLATPNAVIDFKWGVSTYSELLKSGTAFQLAAYAAMARGPGRELPEVAYLTLGRQNVLAPAGSTLKNARTVSDHSTQAMLDGAVVRLGQRRKELAAGVLEAPAAVEDMKAGRLEGAMHIKPKCDYCNFGAVCGKSLRS